MTRPRPAVFYEAKTMTFEIIEFDRDYRAVTTLPSHGCGCCSEDNPEPTHWMPLPEAPAEQKKGK